MVENNKKIWVFDGALFILCWVLLAIIIVLTASNIMVFTIFIMISLFMVSGLYINSENECCIGTVFGKHAGILSDAGLFWSNPFMKKNKISFANHMIKLENFKLNNSDVEISFIFKINNPVQFFYQKVDIEFIKSKLIGFLNTERSDYSANSFNLVNGVDLFECLNLTVLVKKTEEVFNIDKFIEETKEILSEVEEIMGKPLSESQKFDIIKGLTIKSRNHEK